VRKELSTDFLRVGKPLDQRRIDFSRGFLAGAEWAVGVVDKAEDTLQAALRKADTLKEVDS
jgi:hypothetical protein